MALKENRKEIGKYSDREQGNKISPPKTHYTLIYKNGENFSEPGYS